MRAMTQGFGVIRDIPLTVLTLSLVGAVAAPTTAQEVPFIGVVTKDDAKIHCKAARAYVTGTLARNMLVHVEKVVLGWYKIRPPKSTYSFISQAFVDASGKGKTGVVNRNRASVKAVNLEDRGNSYYKQVALPKGSKVQIVDKYGGFYKIVPPEGAYVYVRASAVARATKAQIRQAKSSELRDPKSIRPDKADRQDQTGAEKTSASSVHPKGAIEKGSVETTASAKEKISEVAGEVTPQPPPENNGTESSQTTGDVKSPPATTSPGPGAAEAAATGADDVVLGTGRDTVAQPPGQPSVQTSGAGESAPSDEKESTTLTVVEKWFKEASKLPLENQPIEQLIATYEAIASTEQLGEEHRNVVERRITALRRRAIMVETHKTVEQARQELVEPSPAPVASGTIDQSAKPSPSSSLSAAPPRARAKHTRSVKKVARGDQVGWLLTSNVYNGANLPRLYRLVDPSTKRTIVYIQPDPSIDLWSCLGRLVTVSGGTSREAKLKQRVLKVRRIEVVRMASP